MEMLAVLVWCWLDLFGAVRVYHLYCLRDGQVKWHDFEMSLLISLIIKELVVRVLNFV